MQEKQSRAQELYNEGFTLLLQSLADDSLSDPIRDRAIDLFQDALNAGLEGTDEVFCRAQLGNLLMDKAANSGEINKAMQSGIDNTLNGQKALMEFENSLIIDKKLGGCIFCDQAYRFSYFPKISLLWLVQSRFLKEFKDTKTSISYLESKINMVDYLNGKYFVTIAFELGNLYRDLGDEEKAIEWLKYATNAEIDPNNVDEENDKRMAQNNLVSCHACNVV